MRIINLTTVEIFIFCVSVQRAALTSLTPYFALLCAAFRSCDQVIYFFISHCFGKCDLFISSSHDHNVRRWNISNKFFEQIERRLLKVHVFSWLCIKRQRSNWKEPAGNVIGSLDTPLFWLQHLLSQHCFLALRIMDSCKFSPLGFGVCSI